jgi:hypothetical protein
MADPKGHPPTIGIFFVQPENEEINLKSKLKKLI